MIIREADVYLPIFTLTNRNVAPYINAGLVPLQNKLPDTFKNSMHISHIFIWQTSHGVYAVWRRELIHNLQDSRCYKI